MQGNDIGTDNTGLPTPPATSPVNSPGVGDDGIQILHRNTGSTLNLTILNNRINQTVSEAIRYFTDQDTTTAVTSLTNLRIEINVLTNIDTDVNENEIELISSANFNSTALLAAGSTQTSYIITGNNNGTTGTFGTINITTAANSTSSITQASTAALGTANDNATVTGSPTTFNSGAANPPLPSNPLLFAPGGVASEVLVAALLPPPALPTTDLSVPHTEPALAGDLHLIPVADSSPPPQRRSSKTPFSAMPN